MALSTYSYYRYALILIPFLSREWNLQSVHGFAPSFRLRLPSRASTVPSFGFDSPLKAGEGEDGASIEKDASIIRQQSFDEIVLSRSACKKFQPSSNPSMVQKAYQCLQLAQRAPTGFNTQPYKVILVHSKEQKEKLSRFALGPNRDRVLDSDCTAVFCADRQVLRTLPKFFSFLNQQDLKKRQQSTPRKIQLQLLVYITLFSSGYPLPRIIAAPVSFVLRTIMSIVGCITRWLGIYVLPTLSSAETWSTKQCLLVAMTYMLGCSSRGMATCPMEGINAAGIRRALNIPSRYSIPLIVATGTAAATATATDTAPSQTKVLPPSSTPRYPSEDMIFYNQFGDSSSSDGVARLASEAA